MGTDATASIKLSVPVSGAIIGVEEQENLIQVAMDKWFTEGRFCRTFENQLKEYINTKYLHLVNSGSSASLLAVGALCSSSLGERRLQYGDEVITVAAGFPTTVNPIVQHGLVPVFVDIDIPSYNVNIDALEHAISTKTKAIFLAHTLGNPFNLSQVQRICSTYNLWLIEDCCDALGSTFMNHHVGTFGDIGTLSFFPAHHITTGEGGAIFTKHFKLSKIIRSMRDWGRDCICKPGENNVCRNRFTQQFGTLPFGFDHKYVFAEMGYNLKMTEMQAAIGVAQMQKLNDFVEIRRRNFDYLTRGLKGIKELILPQASKNCNPSWFGYPISVKRDRDALMLHLFTHGIDTRMLFSGNIIRQPYFQDVNYRVCGELTNTDFVMENTFWIGLYPGISQQMLDYQIEKIRHFYNWEECVKRSYKKLKEVSCREENIQEIQG